MAPFADVRPLYMGGPWDGARADEPLSTGVNIVRPSGLDGVYHLHRIGAVGTVDYLLIYKPDE